MTRVFAVAVLALALALAGAAQASWSADQAGTAVSGAKLMPAGNVPSGSVAGSSVTLTWTASTFAGGGAVPGYEIRRFDSSTQVEATVGAACAGTIAATTCTEDGVPNGTWVYTITPAAGAWRGGQSGQSSAVVVSV